MPPSGRAAQANRITGESLRSAQLGRSAGLNRDSAVTARVQQETQDAMLLAMETSIALEEAAQRAAKEVQEAKPKPITGIKLEQSGDTSVMVSQQERKVNKQAIRTAQTTKTQRVETDEKVLYVDHEIQSTTVQAVVAGSPAIAVGVSIGTQPRVKGYNNA
jgi:hypothetical protein